jgi:hypothetical protein
MDGQSLFALFSGRLRSEYEASARSSGRYVHEFDWAGELKRVFRLDRDIRSIAVGPEGRILYGGALTDDAGQ